MTTTVVSTIGTSGRDYSTIQAWEDACPADLVTVDQIWRGECYNDSTFNNFTTISGITTSTNCYVHLTTGAGQSFTDNGDQLTNPLFPNQSYGVLFTRGFVLAINDFIIENLQFSINSAEIAVNQNTLSTGVVIKNIVAKNVNDTTGSGVISTRNAKVFNTLLIIDGTAGTIAISMEGTASVFDFVTAVRINTSVSGTGFRGNYNQVLYTNCVSLGSTTAFNDVNAASNYNASSTASAPGANSLINIVAADQYENPNSDFRLKDGNTFAGAGYTEVITKDIVYQDRANPPSIGCWEYISGSVVVDHHTTGIVIGPGADTTGSATHFRVGATHPTSGAPKGLSSTVTGAASSFSKITSSGVLLGDYGTVTGTAKRFRVHPCVGALLGDFGTVTGTADQSSPVGEHDCEGIVVAGTATVTGASHSVGYRPTTGVVVAGTGTVVGAARHIKKHLTTGNPIGKSSLVTGTAYRADPILDHGTFGDVVAGTATVHGAAGHGTMTLTPADIEAIVKALQLAILPVNIVQVNNLPVDGTGTESDPWGPV